MDSKTDNKSVRATAQDMLYVAVGFGMIGFQKSQVRRRELLREHRDSLTAIDRQIETVEVILDRVVNEVESLLPAFAGQPVATLHSSARRVRTQARQYLLSTD